MNQHSIILALTLAIVILSIYLVVKHSGENEQFRRQCNCTPCINEDWKNCSIYCENICLDN